MIYLTAPYKLPNTTAVSLREVKGRVLKGGPSLCLDVETDGEDIVMLQLGDHIDQYVIDARFFPDEDISSILQLISSSRRIVIGHNIKFDYKMLVTNYGVTLNTVFDTMLAAQVLECGLDSPKGHFTLAGTARRYYDRFAFTNQGNLFHPTITKDTRLTFRNIGDTPFTFEQVFYGTLDIFYTYALYIVLSEKLLESNLTATAKLEFDFSLVAADMELNGFPINTEKWLDNAKVFEQETNKLHDELMGLYPINWNSPKQVMPILKAMGVSTKVLDRKENELKDSIAKTVLSKYSKSNDLVEKYLAYKEAKKQQGTYGAAFLKHVNPITGRIHTNIHQIMNTGRTSSSDVNMQNIPHTSNYRNCFEAQDGYTLIVADFGNQELRILADKSKEPAMLDAFRHNKDIHLQTAKLAFNNPNLTKDSEERRQAKSMNFLMAYGGGPTKLSDTFGISLSESKKLIKLYFNAYPQLDAYFKESIAFTEANGYILIDDVIFRRSYVKEYEEYLRLKKYVKYFKECNYDIRPDLYDRYTFLQSKIGRHSQNYKIQGTAANISKLAGVLLRRKSFTHPFKILLLVHDEYIIECKEKDSEVCKEILSSTMEEASRFFCREISIPADAHITKTWTK